MTHISKHGDNFGWKWDCSGSGDQSRTLNTAPHESPWWNPVAFPTVAVVFHCDRPLIPLRTIMERAKCTIRGPACGSYSMKDMCDGRIFPTVLSGSLVPLQSLPSLNHRTQPMIIECVPTQIFTSYSSHAFLLIGHDVLANSLAFFQQSGISHLTFIWHAMRMNALRYHAKKYI